LGFERASEGGVTSLHALALCVSLPPSLAHAPVVAAPRRYAILAVDPTVTSPELKEVHRALQKRVRERPTSQTTPAGL
jgi:hypothetical protein